MNNIYQLDFNDINLQAQTNIGNFLYSWLPGGGSPWR